MSKQTFKFPTGDFSHTDFAKLNGVTNQQVWTVYSAARKSGQIIPANPPERKNAGKGKPTLMWIVNPNYVAPVVPVTPATPATPATATVTPAATATPAPVVDKAAQKAIKDAQKAVDKAAKDAQKAADKLAKAQQKAADKAAKAAAKAAEKLAKEQAALATAEPVMVAAATPATPPVETPSVETPATVVPSEPVAETVTVPVVEVVAETATAPLAEVTPATAPAAEQPFVVAAVVAEAPSTETFQGRPVSNTRQIDEVCPICGSKCFAADNDTGVYVWCAAPVEVCKANENPYGHANNKKNAFAILVAKYGNKS